MPRKFASYLKAEVLSVLGRLFAIASLVTVVSSCSVWPVREVAVDFPELAKFASYSNLVYEDLPKIEAELSTRNAQLLATNKRQTDDVQYLLVRPADVDYDVIAVRGTASIDDALVDMQIKLKPFSRLGVDLHEGFAFAGEKVYNHVKSKLSKDRSLYITGHSLGGAAAVTLGMLLVNDGYSVQGIYTYGQPKVTNWRGAERFKQIPLTRVVTEKDIVPLVPPLVVDRQFDVDVYWHIGGEVLMLDGSRYTTLSSLQSAARQTVQFIPNVFTQRQLPAHYMDTYRALIAAKIPEASFVEYSIKK